MNTPQTPPNFEHVKRNEQVELKNTTVPWQPIALYRAALKLKNAKGRFHTEQAAKELFDLLP